MKGYDSISCYSTRDMEFKKKGRNYICVLHYSFKYEAYEEDAGEKLKTEI